jgi:hypothetical protein
MQSIAYYSYTSNRFFPFLNIYAKTCRSATGFYHRLLPNPLDFQGTAAFRVDPHCYAADTRRRAGGIALNGLWVRARWTAISGGKPITLCVGPTMPISILKKKLNA